MSAGERDYWRETESGGLHPSDFPPRALVIGITVVAYLVQAAVENAGPGSERFVTEHLALSLDGFLRLELWQLLTYPLLHGSFSHLFWNMVSLYIFGSIAESATTRGEFLGIYALAALGGGGAWLAWAATGLDPGWMPVVGASGAVTGIFVIAALRVPRAKLMLFFVLPVSIWLLALLYVGVDVATALSGHTGGVAVSAHLGGAATAILIQFRPWERFRRGRRAGARPSLLRRDLPPDLPAPPPAREEEESRRVDALLERIHAEGIGSLSAEEREFLNGVSRRLRGR